MGPRNPVEGGFSLEWRSRWSETKAWLPATGAVRPRASVSPDAFVSLSKDAAAGRAAQARRPEGRTTAGGRWRASCASPVVSRSASGPSPDRGVTRPFGALSPPPLKKGSRDRTSQAKAAVPPHSLGVGGRTVGADGGGGPVGGRRLAASRSVTHPTRLETRTKESNMCASQWVLNRPRGAMKAKVGLAPTELGSRLGGRTNDPSYAARRLGGV